MASSLVFFLAIALAATISSAFPINIPTNFSEIQNFQLPRSLTNPNVGVSIDDSVSLSVDPRTGEVNLAGGVSQGFGVDAGIFTKTMGNSVTFTSGKGQASGGGSGSAVSNGGATGSGFIFARVPTVANGLAFSKAQSLTKGIGQFGRGTGSAAGMVGKR
ncbi:hypothetical protein BV898_09143 [Hypsibius exemplaris]|uniref:Uncharacterized protein n=1 Tax=Hypsibius exemplaris TaxID=2072580 RepID=A0A1W0WNQ5_HYPEX|nr:hypothetical protein BV898_09143 [Hypsibius exemplaris]